MLDMDFREDLTGKAPRIQLLCDLVACVRWSAIRKVLFYVLIVLVLLAVLRVEWLLLALGSLLRPGIDSIINVAAAAAVACYVSQTSLSALRAVCDL
jgi:hypothetical protein